MNEPETLAAQNGFSHWAQLNMAAAVPLEAVRDMRDALTAAAGAMGTTGPARLRQYRGGRAPHRRL